MSMTAVTAPQNTSFLRRVPEMTGRAKALLTELNLHFAGVAALGVLVLYLVIHLLLVWQALGSHDAGAIDQARAQMKAAEIAALPLRGLDTKLENSNTDADRFYAQRLPYAYSQVASELGVLAKRAGVRLMHVQYAQSPVLNGKDALTEVRLDVNLTGDYRPIVQFINAAERDKQFFVIGGVNLTGQQTGQVNMRIRLTTYLRAPSYEEMSTQVPVVTDDTSADKTTEVAP